MPISINTNTMATSAALHLSRNSANFEKSLNRLSSGSKLSKSSDDPGGLAVSMKLSAAINRQSASITNVQNAMSFAQLQDGDIASAAKIVDRMTSLRSLYDDVTKGAGDKANYNTEFQALRVQLFQLTDGRFNGISLFSGADWNAGTVANGDTVTVLTSERGAGGSSISLAKIQMLSAMTVRDSSGNSMSVGNYSVQSHSDAQALAASTKGTTGSVSLGSFSVDSFILAIQNLSTLRAENGAMQARFEFALDHLEQNKVNMEAANGRIKDVDIASESTRFARFNILMQAGSAMLAQANVDHSSVAQRLLM
jgi:flagellin